MTVLSTMKKGTGNLAYIKIITLSRLKQKYLFKVNKKASNKNTPIDLGLFKVNNRNTGRNL